MSFVGAIAEQPGMIRRQETLEDTAPHSLLYF
jgi:hypothetical protein